MASLRRLLAIVLSFSVLLTSCERRGDSARRVSCEWLSQLSLAEQEEVESLFRSMIFASSGGPVLFGGKPICSEIVKSPDPENGSGLLFSPPDFVGACWGAARQVLKKHPLISERANFVCVCYAGAPDGAHFTETRWVNRRALHRVVSEHLEVFREHMGSAITPDEVVEACCDSSRPLHVILKRNPLLLGLAFGFGYQNAVHGTRHLDFLGALSNRERLPLGTRFFRWKTFPENYHGFRHALRVSPMTPPHEDMTPRAGYNSLGKEHEMLLADSMLSGEHPAACGRYVPNFGFWPSEETDSLVERYADAVEVAFELMRDDQFLEKIIALFLEES